TSLAERRTRRSAGAEPIRLNLSGRTYRGRTPQGRQEGVHASEAGGAGEGNRTLVVSLGSFCSTIELHPRPAPISPRARRCARGVCARSGGATLRPHVAPAG